MILKREKIISEVFFFVLLLASAYLVWQLFIPFLGALALAAIVTTICYPLHLRFHKRFKNANPGIIAFISVLAVLFVVVLPILLLSYFILGEAVSIYALFNSPNASGFITSVSKLETFTQNFVPGFTIDMANVVQQTAQFFVEHLLAIFASTASTFFLFFIALIAMYYFFKDGDYFTKYLIRLSPLQDVEDQQILHRLAVAVRSVAIGTVSVAIIQGILTSIGLSLVGFDRAILWGSIAAVGALVPGVGTAIVLIPSVVYLAFIGAHLYAVLLAVWGIFAVGLIDNLIGPYLMSRGNKVHQFLILLSVLGGIAKFGPIGFILGPVIISLFLVLVELYHAHTKRISDT